MTTQITNLGGIQIVNDGAVIRIQKNGKILLVAKDQVKTIDTVHSYYVRIDIGEGALKNIFINYQEVSTPIFNSADELRDALRDMLFLETYLGGEAKESTQVNILSQVGQIANILVAMNLRQLDMTTGEPSRVDESNPNTIYRGWHAAHGIPEQAEWAIERVRQVNDEIIHEWANGTKRAIYPWINRELLTYIPYNHDLPVDMPLPLEGPNPVVLDSNPPAYQPAELSSANTGIVPPPITLDVSQPITVD